MMAYAVSEGRLFWLKPSEWSVLLVSAALCGFREFAALGLVEFYPVAYIHRCLLMVEARTNG